MDKQPLTDFLRKNSSMSSETIRKVSDHFELTKFWKNEFFLKEGKVSNLLYLAEGLMRAYTFENIQAITDCVGYSITFEKMNVLFHSVPEFREYGRGMLVKELVSYKKRTLAMINKTAEQRYENLIKDDKEIFQFVQLKHIASYLGVTNSSLSRIRREFTKH
jgi:CRP-like cAMP-binding protein